MTKSPANTLRPYRRFEYLGTMQCVEVAFYVGVRGLFLRVRVPQYSYSFHICLVDRMLITGHPAKERDISLCEGTLKCENLPFFY